MSRLDPRGVHLAVVVGSALVVFGACVSTLKPVEVTPLPRSVSFVDDVTPILDNRCVVCHSCYNSACQLQLGSYEGVERGGSKIPVYLGARLITQPPTRLFFDAQTTAEWRTKGFHSVTENSAAGNYNNSVMLHLLEQKREVPVPTGEYHPEAEDLTCAADTREVSAFVTAHPARGMPFGFPALKPDEHEILATWLQRGANGPSPAEEAALKTPSPAVAKEIDKWEAFLNAPDPKHAMTARYLYEHFFLAHVVFSEASTDEFYRLVRSETPPGEPISVIATVRPYDPPPRDEFFYRFMKIHETIVYKTHMVVEFTGEVFARYQQLFIDTEWLEKPHIVRYGDVVGANPFLIYAQIPPRVRYEFLLDHSEYMLRTFIRGPVCKGQAALNVIRDQFWVMFLDPNADATVNLPQFLVDHAEELSLPDQEGSSADLAKAFSNKYRDRYAKFYHAKVALYNEMEPAGPRLDAIWKGRRAEDAPILTIYRHFDSASVHKGVLGSLPETMWVIDYSQFERIYYALVAGFDVFGNLSHQLNVRRYMDYLRMEGELNFVSFMPPDQRLDMLKSWYIGDGAFEDIDSDAVLQTYGTQVPYKTDNPKRELAELVVDDHILKSTGIKFDKINYYRANAELPKMPTEFNTHEDIVNGFRSLTAPGTAFIKRHTGSNVNLLYVHFRNYRGGDHFITIVINRWHDNVNSIFGEQKFLDPSKDTMDFIAGSVGAYPNFFLEVDGDDIPDFFDMLANWTDTPEYVAKLRKFGVMRGDADFWDSYEWFQEQLDAADPMITGLYDLNRYHPSSTLQN